MTVDQDNLGRPLFPSPPIKTGFAGPGAVPADLDGTNTPAPDTAQELTKTDDADRSVPAKTATVVKPLNKIFFQHYYGIPNAAGIESCNPDGSDLTVIFPDESSGGVSPYYDAPAVSHDGTRLVFSFALDENSGETEENSYGLWVSDIDGNNKTRLVAPVDNTFPVTINDGIERGRWSPDDTRIAFDDIEGHVWIIQADGQGPKILAAENTGARAAPDWLDNDTIVFQQDTILGTGVALVSYRISDEITTVLIPDIDNENFNYYWPSVKIGDDGKAYVIYTDIQHANVAEVTHLAIFHPDGSGGWELDEDNFVPVSDFHPYSTALSPDLGRVVFVNNLANGLWTNTIPPNSDNLIKIISPPLGDNYGDHYWG